jgi:membrane-bound serine protease (ClpP class)
MVLLAIFGLNLLPIQYTAVLLLIAAMVLMVLEAKFASHGALGLAGILCLVFGLATLVNGPTPEMRVHFSVAAGAGVGFGIITFGLAWVAFKARTAKRLTGADAMLGHTAIAMTPLAPHGHSLPGYPAIGQVEVRGEIWQATLPPNTDPIPAGTPVTVRAIHNLTLTVAP